MKTIADIDWNEEAKAIAKERKNSRNPNELTGSAFWNMRAPAFAKHAVETGYAEAFIDIIKPDKNMTVLDIGCGGGTLAVPMANMVKEITAVDFSENMLGIVADKTAELGINNVRRIQCSWTDDWAAAGIGKYDIAISSRSLSVDDMRAALEKLNAAALKQVFVSTIVGDGPHDRRIYETLGRKLIPAVDYIFVYNILYQMGIHGNVSFITENQVRTYDSYDEALASTRWMFQNMTPEEEDKLAAFMKKHLIERKGKWSLDYAKSNKWAVIWWDKEP